MIYLVDCTLRDGGHLNKSKFGEKVINKIVDNLLASNVDIIELGFLKNQPYESGTAVFNCIADAKKVLKPSDKVEWALLAQEDQYDVSKLEECDGTIKHIRVSFHNYDFKEGIEFCKEVIKKGYKCHVNPINLQGYTDKEIIDMISIINDLNPHTFTIVDTFGAMTEGDLNRVVSLVDHNLNRGINIGLHLHENLGLSFSLAQFFTKIKPPTRDISIDASLNGMGRVPGNLSLELIMAYMNRMYNKHYDLNPIYDAIDDCILPIKKEIPWGYSLPYALSAQHRLHRTYAEFLISKIKLKTKDIQNILNSVRPEEKAVYNPKYIQELYLAYLCDEFDDSLYFDKLKMELANERKILLLAPGKSLNESCSKILAFINKYNPIIIATHFSPEIFGIKADYLFFSNLQRYEQSGNSEGKLIITSNLADDIQNPAFVLNFKNLLLDDEDTCDNALLLLLKLLWNFSIKNVYIAGFDGFVKGDNNYYDSYLNSVYDAISDKYNENDKIRRIISEKFADMEIKSLTKSYYIEEKVFV